uniref:G-patch domain-containing protein n=1 Tax=Hyaloperonospora arabidopsidis (strain Emoy2) TaxID=559515 RepID=M4B9B9_HYAAE
MASSKGLSNADFARMFRKDAHEDAEDALPVTTNDSSCINDRNCDQLPSQDAARRRHQETDSTASSQDVTEALRGSRLGYGIKLSSGVGFGSVASKGSTAGSGMGVQMDKTKDRAASARAPAAHVTKSKTFAWEKHTTGFGAKMMAKMGFKGRLGKKEDGVSATIEVKKRPAQMGMGYGDFVEASNLNQNKKIQKELKGESVEEETEEDVRGGVETDALWRKRKVVAGQKRKKHKQAADLMLEAQNMKKQKSGEVVLDMRGPSVRVLSDVTAAFDIDPQRMKAARPKLGDELLYNTRMVVNLAQCKIVELSQKIDGNIESVATMKKELKMIKAQLDVDDVRLQHTQTLTDQLKTLDALREQALDLRSVERLLSHLREIRRNFPLEFDAHKLQQIVPSLCVPPLRDLLTDSNLLEQKSIDRVVLEFRMIQTFLTELPSRAATDAAKSASVLPVIRKKTMAEGDDLYNFILEETLWPAVVQCVNVEWQAKSAPAACVDVFLQIRPYLSGEFEDAFLLQLVHSRLKKECHRWDPRLDTIPIHEWLLPWLPYLGTAMESLYPDIRLALANALSQWHPSDLSVLSVLSPWRELWGEHDYGKFTHRYIVRKLIRCLHREFEIKPDNQSLVALTWVLAWKDHLSDRQFIALMEGEFFPKWLKALRTWVAGSPNLTELDTWYRGWKFFFEQKGLPTNERLRVHFQGALVLLLVATKTVGVPNESRPLLPELNKFAAASYQDALTLVRDEVPPAREVKHSPQRASRSVSLRDVIENLAITHNVTFVPKGFYDGQQLYTFGKHQIIIEQGVVFLEISKGVFKPVDLEQLL